MLKCILLPVAVAASLSAGFPATASSVEEVRVVSYADLDLTRQTGRQVLERRVAAAIREVCGAPVTKPLAEAAHQRACAATALQNAQAQVWRAVDLAHGRPVEFAGGR